MVEAYLPRHAQIITYRSCPGWCPGGTAGVGDIPGTDLPGLLKVLFPDVTAGQNFATSSRGPKNSRPTLKPHHSVSLSSWAARAFLPAALASLAISAGGKGLRPSWRQNRANRLAAASGVVLVRAPR
jgi:hypothetical protein